MPEGHPSGPTLIAIDPGREKCGLAVLGASGELISKLVVPTEALPWGLERLLEATPEATVIMGDGTGSKDLQAALREALPSLPLELVSEHHTTERALELWRDIEPPRGWRRLLPRSLRFPDRPIDDFAAWVLARDFLGQRGA